MCHSEKRIEVERGAVEETVLVMDSRQLLSRLPAFAKTKAGYRLPSAKRTSLGSLRNRSVVGNLYLFYQHPVRRQADANRVRNSVKTWRQISIVRPSLIDHPFLLINLL